MKEKIVRPSSGYLYLFLVLVLVVATALAFLGWYIIPGIVLSVAILLILCGFFIVDPNKAVTLILFGKYVGVVRDNGFFWMNPFMSKKSVSLRARNLNGKTLKVNDLVGNPIEIAAVIVWQVEDTYKALLEVDDYSHFVEIQSEAAVRQLANHYPYDNFESEEVEHERITLRGGTDLVNEQLVAQLKERLALAGIRVLEARISHLAYAAEIAGAMLQRQQATAIVAARRQIVDGAVGMVEMALERLEQHGTITLDEERKAAMVSNLLVVLCGERAASPVVNTGTLY